MNIKILQLFEGAEKAIGLTVIIDVFRAFSTVCYIYNNNVEKIIPTDTIESVYELKKQYPNAILLGEKKGIMPEGFDYGNSPTKISQIDFKDKTIIQRTSSGTRGLIKAVNADEIITGSFVNAQAIINYIKKQNPKDVSLVAMGAGGKRIADEDQLCAKYIKNALEGKPNNFDQIKNYLKTYISAKIL